MEIKEPSMLKNTQHLLKESKIKPKHSKLFNYNLNTLIHQTKLKNFSNQKFQEQILKTQKNLKNLLMKFQIQSFHLPLILQNVKMVSIWIQKPLKLKIFTVSLVQKLVKPVQVLINVLHVKMSLIEKLLEELVNVKKDLKILTMKFNVNQNVKKNNIEMTKELVNNVTKNVSIVPVLLLMSVLHVLNLNS